MDGPGEETDSVRTAREEVIEGFKKTAEIYGLNQSYGRLYGELFFADGPLSLDEIVERTGYAKSTVSSKTKTMQRLHLVHRRTIAGGGKKVFYEAETDFWHVIQELLRREIQRDINQMTRTLESVEEQLEDVDDKRAQRDLKRIRRLESVYSRGQALLDILTSEPIEQLTNQGDNRHSQSP